MNAKISTESISNTKKAPLKCTECGKTFRNAKVLNAHLVHTHQMRPLEPSVVSPEPETPPGPTRNQFSCRVYSGGGTKQNLPTASKGVRVDLTEQRKRKISLYSCPKCPDRFSNLSKVRHHLQTVHGRNGTEMCQIKCIKCNAIIDPGVQHICEADKHIVTKDPGSSFPCGCGRKYSSWPSFRGHIARHHRDDMASFFFPDHEYFLWWKDSLCRSSGLSYELRRPAAKWAKYLPEDEAFTGDVSVKFWHCSHAPATDRGGWCPSAIIVTTFTNGLLVNYVAEHPGFRPAKCDPLPAGGERYSLGEVRDWLAPAPSRPGYRPDGKQLRGNVDGLLKFVADRLEGLDGKHLRSLYSKALGMVMTINDQAQPTDTTEDAMDANHQNHQRDPLNTLIGELVFKPSDLEAKLKKGVETLLGSNSAADSVNSLIDRVFQPSVASELKKGKKVAFTHVQASNSAGEDKSLKIDKVFSLQTPPQAKLTEMDEAVYVKPPGKTRNTKNLMHDAAKSANIVKNSYVDALKKTEPKMELDIEDELLNDVVNKKPQTGNSKTLVQDATKPTSNTYVDTFKSFLEKTQSGLEPHKTPWANKKVRRQHNKSTTWCLCRDRPNCVHTIETVAESVTNGTPPPNTDTRLMAVTAEEAEKGEFEEAECKLETDTDEIVIEETVVGNLDSYEVMEQDNDYNILILKL